MTPGEIIRRTFAESLKDDCFELASQLAFFFFLALFPGLLLLVVIVAYLPFGGAIPELVAALGAVAPAEALTILRAQVDQLTTNVHGGILTFGVIGALWSSSAGMMAMIRALNRAYDVTEHRAWWKRQLVALVLTVVLAVFIVTAFTFLLIGPDVLTWLAARLAFGYALIPLWQAVRWPLMLLFAVVGMDLIYYLAPDTSVPWIWLTPGSALATILWIASSLGFKVYLAHLSNFNVTYGAIAGVAVVLVWFYVSGLAILIGAELNGVIEHGRQQARGRRAF